VPELTRRLFDLVRAGRIAEAMTLQYRLLELFDAMLYSADFPEGFRAGVELRGFAMGRSRQPMSEGQRIDRASLSRVLQCILADFGLVQAPPEGCPTRTGSVEQERVAQITKKVVHELRQRGVL